MGWKVSPKKDMKEGLKNKNRKKEKKGVDKEEKF